MIFSKYLTISFIIIVFLAGVWQCKDTITGGNLSSVVFPASKIPYTTVQQLFNAGCGGQSSACHGPDTIDKPPTGNGFGLDSYDHLMGGFVKVVIRSDPNSSMLILTIEGKGPVQMPPPGQPQLNDNQKKGLRQWVLEGADGGS